MVVLDFVYYGEGVSSHEPRRMEQAGGAVRAMKGATARGEDSHVLDYPTQVVGRVGMVIQRAGNSSGIRHVPGDLVKQREYLGLSRSFHDVVGPREPRVFRA